MKLYLTDQTVRFDRHLQDLIAVPVMRYTKSSLEEKVSSIQTSLKQIPKDLTWFFNYTIFPPHILTHRGQWETEQRTMQAGDTIVQQITVPPLKFFSQKIIVGVRVNSIIKEPGRQSFSYETLEGHVERGESTFSIEEIDGKVIFKISTFSEGGMWLARLLGPVFTSPYQAYCTRQALEHVKNQLEINNQK